jgi:hypothetical protein
MAREKSGTVAWRQRFPGGKFYTYSTTPET